MQGAADRTGPDRTGPDRAGSGGIGGGVGVLGGLEARDSVVCFAPAGEGGAEVFLGCSGGQRLLAPNEQVDRLMERADV